MMIKITKYHQYAKSMVDRQEPFDYVVTTLWDGLPHKVSHERLKQIVQETYELSHGYYDDRGKGTYPSCEIRGLDFIPSEI